jgi:hypothetical protein
MSVRLNLRQRLSFASAPGSLLLDAARSEDVAELERLNLSVKLDIGRCEEIFSSGKGSFAHSGGFFKIMDAAELDHQIASRASMIFVLRTEAAAGATEGAFALAPAAVSSEGTPVLAAATTTPAAVSSPAVPCSPTRIVASLWMALDDPGFVRPGPDFQRYLDQNPRLAQAMRDGEVCYARELIVARDAPHFIDCSRAIFYGAFLNARLAGFRYALAEIYRVVGYGGQSKGISVMNEAALRAATQASGRRVAPNSLRTLHFDEGPSVTIEPQILLFSFDAALLGLRRQLESQGVTLKPEGDRSVPPGN